MSLSDIRSDAEDQLKAEIAAIPESEDAEVYLPPFQTFASALFDAEAEEALSKFETQGPYGRYLREDLAPRIIEGIMPDRGLASVRANRSSELATLSTEQEVGSEILWECAEDGSRRPARKEILAAAGHHGDFERFAPRAILFSLRFRKNASIRESLRQALERRISYWIQRFDEHHKSSENWRNGTMSWEQLAEEFKKITAPAGPLWAQWFAHDGSEDHGIWLLRPEGPTTDEARASFSLLAARAIEMLGIPPLPIPMATEFFPEWKLYCEVEEGMVGETGKPIDLSDAVPHGLGVPDLDAVDPCSRAWLELLRRGSQSFVQNGHGTLTIRGKTFPTCSGEIRDLARASAVCCIRQARELIRARLGPKAGTSQSPPLLLAQANADRMESPPPPQSIPVGLGAGDHSATQKVQMETPLPSPRFLPPPSALPRPSNRAIVRQIFSDQIAYIKLPKMTYEFPGDFPESAKVRFLAKKLHAEEAFHDKKDSIRDFAEAESLLLRLVLQVFVGFAEEAGELGLQKHWNVGALESECLKFVKSYSSQAGLMDRYHLVLPSDDAEIPDGLLSIFESTAEWQKYRQLLIAVADKQAAGEQPEANGEKVASEDTNNRRIAERAARRSQVIMPILEKREWSRGKLVTKSGVGKGTVYEYLDGTREWISFENGEALADTLGLKVTDLPDIKPRESGSV